MSIIGEKMNTIEKAMQDSNNKLNVGFKKYITPLYNYRIAKYELNNGTIYHCIEFQKTKSIQNETNGALVAQPEPWNTLANKAGNELKLNTFEDAEEKIGEYVKSDLATFQGLIKTKTIL